MTVTEINKDILREFARKNRLLDQLMIALRKNDQVRCELLRSEIATINDNVEQLKKTKKQLIEHESFANP